MTKAELYQKAEYLRDSVFAASDGIVTTFAIAAGSTGAHIDNSVVLILGLANLFADSFSMASGNYLGIKSEMDYEVAEKLPEDKKRSPVTHSIYTFISFNLAGLFPLMPYLLGINNPFKISIIIVVIELFLIGVMRSKMTKRSWIISGWEMLSVGGIAAGVAFFVGLLTDKYIT
ncbi:MAG TPA: VIT1/CCC1 transporter family protein [Bacteroidales bacterium]|nr:VIT1/CCC1 transporter family protein [Bacteroidales bacterium]